MALTHVPDPNWQIAETSTWAVVLNTDQSLLGRCFCLLKRPETDVTALTDAELASLWELTRRVKQALEDAWEPDHFNYAFLMNLDKQVHFHIIPRYRHKREFGGGTYVDSEFGNHYGTGPARNLEQVGYDSILNELRKRLNG
ncbi:MAG: HIT family protein [Capsulimonadales bacterium]|nr:HIT family protein [Capsulimonadales bacterium]